MEPASKLIDYWRRLKGSRRAPMRSEIDPRQFPDMLDRFFILEANSPGDVRFRVVGIDLCEWAGFELRGASPKAICADDASSQSLLGTIARVVHNCQGAEIRLSVRDQSGAFGIAKLVLLPVETELGGIDRIMGYFAAPTTKLDPPVTFRVVSSRMGVEAEDAAMKLAEPSHPFTVLEGKSAVPSRSKNPAPKLRVVSDQDDVVE